MNSSIKTVTAKEARDNFTDILGMVYYGNQPVLIEKKGRPFAVIISPQEYKQIDYWKTVKRVQERNADKTESEVMADVTSEVETVRQKMYAAKKRKTSGRR